VLSELSHIQQFTGRTIVVKYGGAAMKNSTLKDKVIRDIVFFCRVWECDQSFTAAVRINSWLDKLGIEPFNNGLR